MYGVSKLAVERYLHAFSAQFGLRHAILRYANVYGERQSPHGEAGVVAIFALRLLAGEQCLVHGHGEDTRDYIHVEDVARANLLVMESGQGGTYNIGTGVETSTNRIFELLTASLRPGATADHGPPRPGDLPRNALDSSRARKELGWEPRAELETALARTAGWFRTATARAALSA